MIDALNTSSTSMEVGNGDANNATSMTDNINSIDNKGKRGISEMSPNNSPPSNHQPKKMQRVINKAILLHKPACIQEMNEFKARRAVCDELRSANIDLTDVKITITLNGNILIYVDSIDYRKRILDDSNLFKGCKRIDLNVSDNKPSLILRGISLHDIKVYEEEGLLKDLGVSEIVAVSSRQENRSLRLVKLIFESESVKEAALKKKFISLDCRLYYLESPGVGPTQCRKCHGFGHVEKVCSSEPVCSNCGGLHPRNACVIVAKSCINCGGRHSALWRGCQAYKKACEVKQSIKFDLNTAGDQSCPPQGFHRNYSQATSSSLSRPQPSHLTDVASVVAAEINQLKTTLFARLDAVESAVSNLKGELAALVKSEVKTELLGEMNVQLKTQGARLAHFVIDCFKVLAPSIRQGSIKANDSDLISKSFTSHCLGSLDKSNFRAYCEHKLDSSDVLLLPGAKNTQHKNQP